MISEDSLLWNLSQLEDDWNQEGGKRPTEQALKVSDALYQEWRIYFEEKDLPNVMPAADGGVIFDLFNRPKVKGSEGHSLNIVIFPEAREGEIGTWTMVLPSGESASRAEKKMEKFVGVLAVYRMYCEC